MKFAKMAAACIVSLAATAMPASAAIVFAGSWEVDSGPTWYSAPPNGPLAYTGQEAAAFLFGGVASQYLISTVDNNPADINHMAWYSVIGYSDPVTDGVLLPENYVSKYLGQFYGPTSGYPLKDPNAAASAYVDDNAQGAFFTNYAFRVTGAVPEAATWVMMILGFGGIGMMLRGQRRRASRIS